MEYILFIHKNAQTEIPGKEWGAFFKEAAASGIFQGGSEIGKRIQLGERSVEDITNSIGGFMRFEAENLESVKTLLRKHPVLINGGTLELCEMPKT